MLSKTDHGSYPLVLNTAHGPRRRLPFQGVADAKLESGGRGVRTPVLGEITENPRESVTGVFGVW